MPVGHTGEVVLGWFSPDGRWALTGSEDDGSAKIWDVRSGRLLWDLLPQDGLSAAVFSPDGQTVAMGSVEGTVRLWDVLKGQVLWTAPGHTRRVHAVAFSKDGKKLVTASQDRTARIWDVASGKPGAELVGHKARVLSVAFSPDGRRVVTASEDGDFSGGGAKIWDAQRGTLLADLNGHTFFVYSAEFSPDGQKVLTASGDRTARIWDAGTGAPLATLKGHTGKVLWAVFSPDGKSVLTASDDKTARIWRADSGASRAVLSHDDRVTSARFSPDGRWVATASLDGTAGIWKAADGELFARLKGHTEGVLAAAFSADSRNVLTASADRTAVVWDVASTAPTAALRGHAAFVKTVAFSPDGRSILVATERTPRIVDLASGTPLASLEGHSGWVRTARYSPDGRRIATAADDGTAKVWDAATGALQLDLKGHDQVVLSADFSPDGARILTVDGRAQLWDAGTGKRIATLEGHTGSVEYAAFSQNGNRVVSTSRDGSARVWDAHTGRQIAAFQEAKKSSTDDQAAWRRHLDAETQKMMRDIDAMVQQSGDWIWHAAFSPDDRLLVTSSLSGAPLIWDVDEARVLQVLEGHTDAVYASWFSPDGNKVVTVSEDRTARIWDVRTGKALARLKGHKAGVASAFFSPDGQKIYTAAWDNTVNTWDASSGRRLAGFQSNGEMKAINRNADQCITVGRAWLNVHNLHSGTTQYTWVALNDSDWMVQLPDTRYYMCSKDAARRLHYVTEDLKTVGFEQLDIRFNRPDKVLAHLASLYGQSDSVRIHTYQNAWQKRVKRLGIDTSAFAGGLSAPECDIVNRAQIEPIRSLPQLELQVRASDAGAPIDRLRVWVNEVPVFGAAGIPLGQKRRYSLDTTITITLSAGQNTIETSVTNTQGIESYRMPLVVQYKNPAPETGKMYFVGLGVGRYRQDLYNLKYPAKDIRDLSARLQDMFGKGLITHTLLDEQVTREQVRALKNTLMQAAEDDRVMISFSGHGVLDTAFDYYLSTHDMDFQNPNGRGLAYEDLEWLMDGIRSRKKLLLLDACHSGEVDKETLMAMTGTTLPPEVKGVVLPNAAKPAVGLKSSLEWMQELFADVSRGTGTTVIAASGGTQYAYEKDDLKQGVFTFCLLERMREEAHQTVSALKTSMETCVFERTNGLQKPTSRRALIHSDWRVW